MTCLSHIASSTYRMLYDWRTEHNHLLSRHEWKANYEKGSICVSTLLPWDDEPYRRCAAPIGEYINPGRFWPREARDPYAADTESASDPRA